MRLAILAVSFLPTLAAAQDVISYDYAGSFDDATFGVENAILNKGLVVDHVSHVGDMLNRTQGDVGGDPLFSQADVFLFCSATVSREVMEADPDNIAFCPYGIFVAEQGGQVRVGYRTYPDGPMDQVEALLDDSAREAAE